VEKKCQHRQKKKGILCWVKVVAKQKTQKKGGGKGIRKGGVVKRTIENGKKGRGKKKNKERGQWQAVKIG